MPDTDVGPPLGLGSGADTRRGIARMPERALRMPRVHLNWNEAIPRPAPSLTSKIAPAKRCQSSRRKRRRVQNLSRNSQDIKEGAHETKWMVDAGDSGGGDGCRCDCLTPASRSRRSWSSGPTGIRTPTSTSGTRTRGRSSPRRPATRSRWSRSRTRDTRPSTWRPSWPRAARPTSSWG